MLSLETQGSQPLVSIGMPVYNRPDGLRRSLTCLIAQTHRNIEIIISDNCSPDMAVRQVVEEFMRQDSRISYFRQEETLPIDGNFKFVLKQAVGDYFMWAADDDEWDALFIEQCLQTLQQDHVVSVMSNFEVLYRFEGRREAGRVAPLSFEYSQADNAHTFLKCMTPSLFYGLHRRNKISFFLQDTFFDFYDCYFMLRLILSGRVAVIDPVLYTAGVDTPAYQVKPARKYRFTNLKYSPLLYGGIRQIFSSALNLWEKFSLVLRLITVVVSLFFFHEIKRGSQ